MQRLFGVAHPVDRSSEAPLPAECPIPDSGSSLASPATSSGRSSTVPLSDTQGDSAFASARTSSAATPAHRTSLACRESSEGTSLVGAAIGDAASDSSTLQGDNSRGGSDTESEEGEELGEEEEEEEERKFAARAGVVLKGRYTIVSDNLLGEGTYSRVLRAVDGESGLEVAVKVSTAVDWAMDSQRDEARFMVTARQHHELSSVPGYHHLPHLIDGFRIADRPKPANCTATYKAKGKSEPGFEHVCLVYELLGPSLEDVCDAESYHGMAPAALQEVARQLLAAHRFLHSMTPKLVHADGKPANVMFLRYSPASPAHGLLALDKPDVKLIDFSLSCELDVESGQSSAVCQTITHQAPEVALDLPFDEKVDVWALGLSLYEVALGHPPTSPREREQALVCAEILTGQRLPGALVDRLRRRRKDPHNVKLMFDKKKCLRDWESDPSLATDGMRTAVSGTVPLPHVLFNPDRTPADKFSQIEEHAGSDCLERLRVHYERHTEFWDMIRGMLALDPAERLSMEDCLQHPFFARRYD